MVHLTLVSLSEDGTRLLLVDDAGAEFTLAADAKLRAALRGDHTRLGQLEIHMESALRPRDIQTRIRAGETPEAVAAAAQTTVEKIMPFAAPVLAEREHIADRAQRASVRRRSDAHQGSTGTARTLGDTVAAQLSDEGVHADALSWDAFRREDGRWTLTGDFTIGKRTGQGRFTFDAPGNFVTADNDDARWLLGEETTAPSAPPRAPSQRRLSAVPQADELPLGDDAIALVSEPAPPAAPAEDSTRTADLSETVAAIRAAEATGRDNLETTEGGDTEDEGSFFDAVFDRAEQDDQPETTPARESRAAEDVPSADPTPEPPAKPTRKKGARASVPSWDEIMFGSGPGKD